MLETLYTVESIGNEDDAQVTAQIRLNGAHKIFQAHFPAAPILPGVCMLRIVHDVIARASRRALRLTHATSVKFLIVVDPREDAILLLNAEMHRIDGQRIETKATLSTPRHAVMKFRGVFSDAPPPTNAYHDPG